MKKLEPHCIVKQTALKYRQSVYSVAFLQWWEGVSVDALVSMGVSMNIGNRIIERGGELAALSIGS